MVTANNTDAMAQARPAAERGKLHVPLVEAYEAQILSGTLKVGDRLPSEAEIARQFQVSTRSVREALQILETKRLVRRKHGERAMVVRDDVSEFLGSMATTVKALFANNSDYLVQLIDVRRIIEVEVVTRLSAVPNTMQPEVAAALERMRLAAEAGNAAQFTECDAAFHLALVQSVDNKILDVVYDNLFSILIDVIRVTSRVPNKTLLDGYAEHEQIFDLIQAGETEAARAAILRQIDHTANYLSVAINSAKSPLEENP